MKTIGMKPQKKQNPNPDKPPEQEKKPEDTKRFMLSFLIIRNHFTGKKSPMRTHSARQPPVHRSTWIMLRSADWKTACRNSFKSTFKSAAVRWRRRFGSIKCMELAAASQTVAAA